jgi:hypothetical protein
MNEKSERSSVEQEEEAHMFSNLLLGAGCTSNAGQVGQTTCFNPLSVANGAPRLRHQ